MRIQTLAQAKRLATVAGNNFFASTDYWQTEYVGSQYAIPHGLLFITSEPDPGTDNDRRFTVRAVYFDDADRFRVDTLGKFREWPTLAVADRLARDIQDAIRNHGKQVADYIR